MIDEELESVFRTELETDIPELSALIEQQATDQIRMFAHKYKVRLQYLNHYLCYERCLDIESYHRDGRTDDLMHSAAGLLDGLRNVKKSLL